MTLRRPCMTIAAAPPPSPQKDGKSERPLGEGGGGAKLGVEGGLQITHTNKMMKSILPRSIDLSLWCFTPMITEIATLYDIYLLLLTAAFIYVLLTANNPCPPPSDRWTEITPPTATTTIKRMIITAHITAVRLFESSGILLLKSA